jgi:Domain of unknown function (DUF4160)
MVTMYRGTSWKITVYGRDHGIPHFHIEGPDFRCSVAIISLDLIIGFAPPVVIRDAINWAAQNQSVLMSKWKELNP